MKYAITPINAAITQKTIGLINPRTIEVRATINNNDRNAAIYFFIIVKRGINNLKYISKLIFL